jgi:hypothetical protein
VSSGNDANAATLTDPALIRVADRAEVIFDAARDGDQR